MLCQTNQSGSEASYQSLTTYLNNGLTSETNEEIVSVGRLLYSVIIVQLLAEVTLDFPWIIVS